jgi:hypothetical protein
MASYSTTIRVSILIVDILPVHPSSPPFTPPPVQSPRPQFYLSFIYSLHLHKLRPTPDIYIAGDIASGFHENCKSLDCNKNFELLWQNVSQTVYWLHKLFVKVVLPSPRCCIYSPILFTGHTDCRTLEVILIIANEFI